MPLIRLPDGSTLDPEHPEKAPGPDWSWVGSGRPTDRHPRGCWVHRISGACLRPHSARWEDEPLEPTPHDGYQFRPDDAPKVRGEPRKLFPSAAPPEALAFLIEGLAAGHRLARQVAAVLRTKEVSLRTMIPAGVTWRRVRALHFGILDSGDRGTETARETLVQALADQGRIAWDALVFEDPLLQASFPAAKSIPWPWHRHGEDIYHLLGPGERSAEAIRQRLQSTEAPDGTRGFHLHLPDTAALPPPGSGLTDAQIDGLAAQVRGGWVDIYDGDLFLEWEWR